MDVHLHLMQKGIFMLHPKIKLFFILLVAHFALSAPASASMEFADFPEDLRLQCFHMCDSNDLANARAVCVRWCRMIEDGAEFPSTIFLHAVPNESVSAWLDAAYNNLGDFGSLSYWFKNPKALMRLQIYGNHLSPGSFKIVDPNHPDPDDQLNELFDLALTSGAKDIYAACQMVESWNPTILDRWRFASGRIYPMVVAKYLCYGEPRQEIKLINENQSFENLEPDAQLYDLFAKAHSYGVSDIGEACQLVKKWKPELLWPWVKEDGTYNLAGPGSIAQYLYDLWCKGMTSEDHKSMFYQLALIHLGNFDVDETAEGKREDFEDLIWAERGRLEKKHREIGDAFWSMSGKNWERKHAKEEELLASLWKPWIKFAEYINYSDAWECALDKINKLKLNMPAENIAIFQNLSRCVDSIEVAFIVNAFESYVACGLHENSEIPKLWNRLLNYFSQDHPDLSIIETFQEQEYYIRLLASLEGEYFADKRQDLMNCLLHLCENKLDAVNVMLLPFESGLGCLSSPKKQTFVIHEVVKLAESIFISCNENLDFEDDNFFPALDKLKHHLNEGVFGTIEGQKVYDMIKAVLKEVPKTPEFEQYVQHINDGLTLYDEFKSQTQAKDTSKS